MNVTITTTPEDLERRIALAWNDGYNAGRKDGTHDAMFEQVSGPPRLSPWERAQAHARRGMEYIIFKR